LDDVKSHPIADVLLRRASMQWKGDRLSSHSSKTLTSGLHFGDSNSPGPSTDTVPANAKRTGIGPAHADRGSKTMRFMEIPWAALVRRHFQSLRSFSSSRAKQTNFVQKALRLILFCRRPRKCLSMGRLITISETMHHVGGFRDPPKVNWRAMHGCNSRKQGNQLDRRQCGVSYPSIGITVVVLGDKYSPFGLL
jgi:hypothetical protein